MKARIRNVPDQSVTDEGMTEIFNHQMFTHQIVDVWRIDGYENWFECTPFTEGTFAHITFTYHRSWLEIAE